MMLVFASVEADRVAAHSARWRGELPGGTGAWLSADRIVAARGSSEALRSSHVGRGVAVFGRARLGIVGESMQGRLTVDGQEALTRVGDAYLRDGIQGVTALTGEFGVVIWDGANKTAIAIRDPLGLAPLYYKASETGLYVSNRADVFPESMASDLDFIATFIASGGSMATRTIWSGVLPVPHGCALAWQDGRVRCDRYWSPETMSQHQDVGMQEAAREFQRLFKRAVLECLEPGRKTWAYLSGGLDSSAVVSAAAVYGQDSADRPLGGTITYSDSIGGDETRFVDAVVRKFRLRNERFNDPWPWHDDGQPPPITPEPSRDFPYYARDRATAAVMASAGATTVLSGIGPDCYLPFGAAHIPDLLLSRGMREGGRQLFMWSYVRRESIWSTFRRDVLLSFAPVRMQSWFIRRRRPIPGWLRPDFVRRHALRKAWGEIEVSHGRIGHVSQVAVSRHLSRVASRLHAWRSMSGIEIRHPFLSLPLVELCVQLPHTIRSDVGNAKPVLRAAMEGVVPDEVLRRQCTKGTVISPRMCWAFSRERATLARLLKSPILADLGCIEPKKLLADLDAHASGMGQSVTSVYTALSLETWLSTRASRYVPQVG